MTSSQVLVGVYMCSDFCFPSSKLSTYWKKQNKQKTNKNYHIPTQSNSPCIQQVNTCVCVCAKEYLTIATCRETSDKNAFQGSTQTK